MVENLREAIALVVEVETGAESRLGNTSVEVDGAEPCRRRGS